MHTPNQCEVVIIGAGVTGLSAAYYAKVALAKNRSDARILIVDGASRSGGKIRTEWLDSGGQNPFLLEWGADSMLSTKPSGIKLIDDLGLGGDVIETRRERQIFMLKKGQLLAMPEGLQLVIPKRLWPFIKSPLFTMRGKLRMAQDLVLAKSNSLEDESVAAFVRRRLGQEALDLLAEPILSGIYSSDPERQSLNATFPQLKDLEHKYRSLILGAWRSQTPASTGERPKSLFISLKNGMQTLLDRLTSELKDELRLNTAVDKLMRTPQGWCVHLANGEIVTTTKVIIATPSHVTASIIRDVAPEAAALLMHSRHTSSGSAYLAYKREDVAHALGGYGLLIPKTENRLINAVTWVSSKIEGRAPMSHVLFRTFFGGERRPQMMQLSDEHIGKVAEEEVAQIHGISAAPEWVRVFRAQDGNPQYDVGHLERVSQIEKLLPSGLIVTGCDMRGVGIPDCIAQGKMAGELGVDKMGVLTR